VSAVAEERPARASGADGLQPSLIHHFDLLAGSPGGVDRLRQLILKLAIQGRLVPQDASDEPAPLLLTRVRGAKIQLAVEGRIGRDKPLLPISEDEALFSLPKGWAWCRLADLAWPQAGFAFKSSGFNEVGQGLPLIRIRDVGSGLPPTTFFSGEYREEFLVESGDWLISMDGEFRVRRWHGTKALLNQRVTRLVFHWAEVHTEFIAAALQMELTALQGTKAYTTVDHLSGKQIAEAAIALPPANEQARIVSRVNELMRLCDELEEKGRLEAEQHTRLLGMLLSTLPESASPEELATNWQRVAEHFEWLIDRPEAVDVLEQTFLQVAVRGLLVPPQSGSRPASLPRQPVASITGCISTRTKTGASLAAKASDIPQLCTLPAHWVWARFSDVAVIASDLVSPLAHPDAWQIAPDCIEKRTGRLLSRRRVREAGVTSPNHRFASGQILYSKIRPSLSKAARVDFEGLCSADMYPITSRIDADYLLMYMLSDLFLIQVASAENRVKMPKLNQEALKSFLVAVPPPAVQARIVSRVADLRRLCEDLRQRMAACRAVQLSLADVLVE
jgi:type I restriction enzyme S subunit